MSYGCISTERIGNLVSEHRGRNMIYRVRKVLKYNVMSTAMQSSYYKELVAGTRA